MCSAALIGCLPLAAAAPEQPGQLTDVRPLDRAWSFLDAAKAFELRYSTIDQWNETAEASGALYLPSGTAPAGGWPLIVWAHGTVGIGDACAPSHRPQSERNTAYFNAILSHGYAVLAPDYQGLGTAGQFSYYNTNVEGHSILDAVAAIRDSTIALSQDWVIIGQSEGAHAAMAAASLYPEQHKNRTGELRAVIATGLRADPARSLRDMFARSSSGSTNQVSYAGYFLASLHDLHADRVEPYLSEFGRQYVEAARTQCLSDLVALADGRRPADLVTNPDAPTPTFDADITALTNYRQYDLPSDVMIGYGTADIDVPPTDTEAYGQTLQQQNPGIAVTIKSYADKDHSGAFLASLPDALTFLNTHLS